MTATRTCAKRRLRNSWIKVCSLRSPKGIATPGCASRRYGERLTDQVLAQAIIVEVARNASSNDLRKAAVQKLTDQAVLAEIAAGEGK